jgi:hypothetical protein
MQKQFRQSFSSHDYHHKLLRYEPETRNYDMSAEGFVGWLLGPDTPEMQAIEDLLRKSGEKNIAYAETDRGIRVTRQTAYQAMGGLAGTRRYTIDCNFGANPVCMYDLNCDRPGDRGYLIGPAGFMFGSCLGQTLSEVVKFGLWKVGVGSDLVAYDQNENGAEIGEIRWDWAKDAWVIGVGKLCGLQVAALIPREYVYLAASSFCLTDAYSGNCPGVDPTKLLELRVAERVRSMGGSSLCSNEFSNACGEIRSRIRDARDTFKSAKKIDLTKYGKFVRIPEASVLDLRNIKDDPLLLEAAAFYGECIIGYDDMLGRTFMGGRAAMEHIETFMKWWAPDNGLKNIWGSPARGYAEAF